MTVLPWLGRLKPAVWSVRAFALLLIFGMVLSWRNNRLFAYGRSYYEIDPISSVLAGLPLLLVQLVVLFAIVGRLDASYSWVRILCALGVFSAWTFFLILGVMHAPGWYHANVFWLLGVDALLAIALVAHFFIRCAKRFMDRSGRRGGI